MNQDKLYKKVLLIIKFADGQYKTKALGSLINPNSIDCIVQLAKNRQLFNWLKIV